MLHGLERPDRNAELPALLGVLDRELHRTRRGADSVDAPLPTPSRSTVAAIALGRVAVADGAGLGSSSATVASLRVPSTVGVDVTVTPGVVRRDREHAEPTVGRRATTKNDVRADRVGHVGLRPVEPPRVTVRCCDGPRLRHRAAPAGLPERDRADRLAGREAGEAARRDRGGAGERARC